MKTSQLLTLSLSIVLIPALLASHAFASCGEKYEAAITALKPLVERQQEIESDRNTLFTAGVLGGLAIGVSAAPAIVPATGAVGTAEATSFGQWAAASSIALAGTSSAEGFGQTTLKDVEGHPVATLANHKIVLETLREAYLGGGEKIYAFVKEALASDFPNKDKLSPESVSRTIVKLDEQQAFCTDTLDSPAQLSKRVLDDLQ